MDLAERCHRLTAGFPRAEQYRLTSQLIRAAISIPANIAEGHARSSRKDYARFIAIARGSLAETETFLLLAERLELATEERLAPVHALANRVGRMLTGLHGRLTEGIPSPHAPEPSP